MLVASRRYTFRIKEQENIWEYYKVLLQRLRTRVDNPYSPRADGIAPDDNTQLYCIREALVNMLAHADYFSEIHSTVRVYDDSILLQNAGGFPVNLDIVGRTLVSQPRNPNILRFFKLAKISENGGFGIDKILNWTNLTGGQVTIESDLTKSEVRFEIPNNIKQHQTTSNDVNSTEKSLSEQVMMLIGINNKISISDLAKSTNQSRSSIDRTISALKKSGKLSRSGTARNGKWEIL